MRHQYKKKYRIGQRFNDWKLIHRDTDEHGSARYTFRCVPCGKEKVCNIGNVTNEKSKGCGCKSAERQSRSSAARTHGEFHTLEYKAWEGARRWARDNDLPFEKDWDDFAVFIKEIGYLPGPFYWLKRHVSELGWVRGNVFWKERNLLDEKLIQKILKMRLKGIHRSVVCAELKCGKAVYRKALDILIERKQYSHRQKLMLKTVAKPKTFRRTKSPL